LQSRTNRSQRSSFTEVFQLFLSSPKPVLKFAAIKSLNKLSMVHPAAVSGCNVDIENLITDPNRSIATYAITTLLKVCIACVQEPQPQAVTARISSDRK
jgi:hypothetical protein